MKRKSAFLEIVARRLKRAGRHHISRLPAYPTLPPPIHGKWRPALNASRANAAIGRCLILLASFLIVCRAVAGVRAVGEIGLTVGDLQREVAFYTNTLPFELISISDAGGADEDSRLGLTNARLRIATLQLGDERITLTQYAGASGKPIPEDSRSFDHWFQHIAIVVSDMDRAFARLRAHHVKYVSTAPQTLPAWNKNAAGIKAFYFRDPENHVLEIIYLPPGKGGAKWHSEHETRIFLGIDHTAIVVSDTATSLAFYRDLLGMRVAGESENYGVEQEHLNHVFGARLRITALRAAGGPGIEFLEYLTPSGGRALPSDAKATDLIFWNTHLLVDDLTDSSTRLRKSGARFISQVGTGSQVVRDPDGHALQIDAAAAPATDR